MRVCGKEIFTANGDMMINIIDWYDALAATMLGEAAGHYWGSIFSAAGAFIIVTLVGLAARLRHLNPEKMSDEQLLPQAHFGLRAFLEMCWGVVSSTLESVIGAAHWMRFVPLLAGTFFFVILVNLSGLIPGFSPATHTMNMTLGMALVIFFAFNFYGLKYGGWSYVKHLLGPVFWLAPLIFPIEVISLCARPISLSLRLFGNISGDHLVFQVFSTLVGNAGIPWFPVPGALLGFGLLVACLQAFIFMTLSAVYVKLSVDTGHGDEHH
jgi:F-type H+-transporting ATPase subunit a